nr:MAG TPA: hypothetical protein [Caudoviricetes sp.]
MKLIDILIEELPKRGGWPDGAEKYCSYNGEAGAYKPGGIEIKKALITGIDTQICDVVYAGQYEAALAAKNEGWIEWGGGECPVEEGTLVDVRFRDGYDDRNIEAIDLLWNHDNWSADIIAYRPHKPDIKSRANNDRMEQDLNECIGQDVDMPEWNGEGLPPIGCACEMQDSKGTWLPVDIIAKNDGFTFGWSYDYRLVFFGDKADEFRPLRTEADKKREEVIMSLAKAVNSANFTYGEKLSDGQLLGSMWYELYNAIAAGKIPGVKLED